MGGLDSLIPDDVKDSSSSSSSRSTQQKEYVEKFSSNLGTKKFTEEQWENIKRVIRKDTEYTVGQVRSMQSEERHNKLHEISQIAYDSDFDKSESDLMTDVRCSVCGEDCSESYVKIDHEPVHIQHTLAQVVKELELEKKGKAHEESN